MSINYSAEFYCISGVRNNEQIKRIVEREEKWFFQEMRQYDTDSLKIVGVYYNTIWYSIASKFSRINNYSVMNFRDKNSCVENMIEYGLVSTDESKE